MKKHKILRVKVTKQQYDQITHKASYYGYPTISQYIRDITLKDIHYIKLLKEIHKKCFQKDVSVFNLWEGKKYKSNILKYKKDYNGYHPTQKPILLLEDLIKTFSNKNDLVVDLTMGSGSTGVACINTNRNFIGIEKDDKYFYIAEKRIKEVKDGINHNIF